MTSETARPPNPRRLLLAAGIAVVLAGGIAANGLISRARGNAQLVQWTNAHALPTVALATLSHGGANQSLILPGTIQPYNKAAIYARVSGYLKAWQQDIGAHVTAGQVLASIDTPDLDQQLQQARATLASAKANYDIAVLTANRDDILAKKQALSQELADQTAADAGAKKAIMDA